MNVINIHKRLIQQPEEEVVRLFQTLTTSEDEIWPKQKWPDMRFKNGLHVGSRGGHGIVRYTIIEFTEGRHIKFQFTKPDGFNGTHALSIRSISKNSTEICHQITMKTTTLKATLLWSFIVRWLHDALIEEAFDNVEHYFYELSAENAGEKKMSTYNLWVIMLRNYYKRRLFRIKQA